MKERPIIFTAPMVRAILDGRKTQTRRVVKPQIMESHFNPPRFEDGEIGDIYICPDILEPATRCFVERTGHGIYHNMGTRQLAEKHCPYGTPGDQLWVRETWAEAEGFAFGLRYRADGDEGTPNTVGIFQWKPSIHMPRWASRINLHITNIRVEPLQNISEEDAMAEGITTIYPDGPRKEEGPNHFTIEIGHVSHNAPTASGVYSRLWEIINGTGSWDKNPWVWVIEFSKCDAARAPE